MSGVAAYPARSSPGDVDGRPTPTVPFAADLAAFGDRPALVTARADLTYAQLAERVAQAGASLGGTRRLVLVEAANDLDALTAYLGALAAGHPVLLVPGGQPHTLAGLVDRYDPDVVCGHRTDGWTSQERRPGSRHTLHPELALLLSTSGSTGSPKLVRLSQRNLASNAEAIATYLRITTADRAATTLPLHYCYGLSVLHSHLTRGASLLVTDRSVSDPAFWSQFRTHGATSLAGVPYTFDLLDTVGFDEMDLPGLRYVTQAGGRLPPDRVRRYAQLGRRRGFDFVVMYGQTEATARMAYLPPHLADRHPHTVGRPVPGGEFRLDPVPESAQPDGSGELVYHGPNVMLGYAEQPADLALGRTVHELRTGDLARRTPEGLYEIVGRRARFTKVLGLRIDLGRVDDALSSAGLRAACAAGDDRLTVAVEEPADIEQARKVAARASGLPTHLVRVSHVEALPRLPTGKLDVQALTAQVEARPIADTGTEPAIATGPVDPTVLRQLFAELLAHPNVTDEDTFAGLGGDSLSYVEMTVRLEELLGRLPADWHRTPIAALARSSAPHPRRRRWLQIETTVVLRATAILAIVASHTDVLRLQGGAHVLLAVAGFNVARFQLTAPTAHESVRRVLRAAARVALPSIAVIATALLLGAGEGGIASISMLNWAFGPDQFGPAWRYWFVEALVVTLLGLAVLLALPGAYRVQRRHPFGAAAALLGMALLVRFDVLGQDTRWVRIFSPHEVFWLFALGWAAAAATTWRQRAALSAATLAAVPGFLNDPRRENLVAAGLVLLLWSRTVPVPRLLRRPVTVLAASSLCIYLTHWQVYPHLRSWPLLGLAASLVVGVAVRHATRSWGSRLPRPRRGAPAAGGPGSGLPQTIPAPRRERRTQPLVPR